MSRPDRPSSHGYSRRDPLPRGSPRRDPLPRDSPSREPPSARRAPATAEPADIAQLRARRARARRRTRLARIDLALGVLGGLALLLASPGPAMTAAIVLVVLALCATSIPLERAFRRDGRGRR